MTRRRNDWMAQVADSAKILGVITLIFLLAGLFVSCNTQEKVSRTDVVEAETNRVWYEHSMENCGKITDYHVARSDSAIVITNRKIIVYDTSQAVLDTATGTWSAPVAYEIVEDISSSSGSVERTDSVEVDSTEVVVDKRQEVDSTYKSVSTLDKEKKRSTSSFGVFKWGILLGALLVVTVFLWAKKLWIFK